MTGTPKFPLDRNAWTEQFTALYDLALGNLPGDVEGELSVCAYDYNHKRNTARWTPLGTVPFQNDADDLAWELIKPYAKTGSSIYFGVGVRKVGTEGQGKEKDILAHAALGVDLDAADGVHAASDTSEDRDDFSDVTEDQITAWKTSGDDGKTRPLPRATRDEADGWTQDQLDLWLAHKGPLPLPTTKEIDGWIKNMPVEPTLVTETGGGFHVYVTLTHPVDVQFDMVGKRVRAGWIAHWLKTSYESRRQIDNGPLKNAAGVLRMAGTPNHKLADIAHIVLIDEHNEGVSYTHEEMIDAFALNAADLARVASLTERPTSGMVMDIANPKDRPHDLSERSYPMDRLTDEMPLTEVGKLVGIKWSGSVARVGWLDASGEYEYNRHTTNASTFVGETETLLKIWGPGTEAQWMSALNCDRSTHTAAQILQLALIRLGVKEEASFSVGATLANRYRTVKKGIASYGSLIDDLMDAENADDVQALIDAKPAAAPSKPRTSLPAEPAAEVIILDVEKDEPGTDVVAATKSKPKSHETGLAHTSTRPFRDALADPRGEEYIVKMESAGKDEENAFVVRVSRDASKHGLFKRVVRVYEGKDGEDVQRVYYSQVTDFVLFIDTINASRSVSGMDSVEVTGKDFTTVSVALSDGRYFTTRALDSTASRSPTTVVRELSTFTILSEPYDDGETRAFKAMIVEMGKHAVRRQTVLNKIDWFTDPATGEFMYVTPNGALRIDRATGKPMIDTNIIAAESAKNSKLKGTAWQSEFGFDRIATPEEVAEKMPQMIADYCALLPGKEQIAQALLGSFFLSFLPGGNRSSVILVGINATMKSSLVKHLALLVADHRKFGKDQPFSVNIDTDSKAAARTSTHFQGTAPNFCEDFLTSNNPSAKEMERRLDILEEVTTAAFSGAGAARGQGTDERADRKVISGTPFITAETLTAGESRIGRAITLPINRGDVSLEKSKAFQARWIDTGVGREIVAGWLANLIADYESTFALATSVNRERDDMNLHTIEINSTVENAQIFRMSSNATQVLAGLTFLVRHCPGADWSLDGAEWATMQDDDMNALVTFLRDDNVERVLDANPAHKMIGSLASGIGSKQLYLENWAGGVPETPDRYGWSGHDLGGTVDWRHTGTLAGRVSKDGKRIFIFAEGMNYARRSAGVMGRGSKEIAEKLAEYVRKGTTPGGLIQAKSEMVNSDGSRFAQRCFVFDAETLGLEIETDTEIDPTLPTAAGAVRARQDEAASSDF